MTETITADFRDYNSGLPEEGTFSLNTATDEAGIAAEFEDRDIAAHLSADVARQLGTDLLRWTGGPCTGLLEPETYDTTNGVKLIVDVVDAHVSVTLEGNDGTELTFEPNDEQVVDIGQRLIVWAGPDLRVATDV